MFWRRKRQSNPSHEACAATRPYRSGEADTACRPRQELKKTIMMILWNNTMNKYWFLRYSTLLGPKTKCSIDQKHKASCRFPVYNSYLVSMRVLVVKRQLLRQFSRGMVGIETGDIYPNSRVHSLVLNFSLFTQLNKSHISSVIVTQCKYCCHGWNPKLSFLLVKKGNRPFSII